MKIGSNYVSNHLLIFVLKAFFMVIVIQEIVYQSIRNSITSNTGNTSKDCPGINNQLSDEGKDALAGKCSPFENLESQLAEDEALARALQASLSEISSNEEASEFQF